MATTEQKTDQVLTSSQDGIFRIQMNRPEKKNALTQAMYLAIGEGLEEADKDDAVRVIILTGTDDCFCAGNDVMDFKNVKDQPQQEEEAPRVSMIPSLMAARKPIIASVSGFAIGIGTTMLLHCDLVYAAQSAVFRLPFVNLGLCPEAGSSFLLPQMMGYQRSAELIFLGDKFDAETACQAGIVNAVYPDAELNAEVMQKAKQLAGQPPAAMRITKALLKRGHENAVKEASTAEMGHFSRLVVEPEAVEAFAAFAERREPDFSHLT